MTGPELHVIVPGSIEQRTGGYIYDARMVEGLRRRGWEVIVHGLSGRFPSGDAEAGTRLSEALHRIRDGARVVLDGLAMGALPDIVRAQSERLRLIALVHHRLADETGLERTEQERLLMLEREALIAAAGVIVTSSYTSARVQELGVGAESIRVVVPGVDLAPPADGPAGDDPPRLLCVASVTPRKGQDVLVRALAGMVATPWTCVCAGSLTRSPRYAAEVQERVREAGLSDRITFRGECDDDSIDALYATSSVFVLPSHYEGYGMVLTEAMARGLPVVSTTGGAIPGTVPDDAGILVPAGDETALASALRSLLVDPTNEPGGAAIRRRALGDAGRRHVSTLPDWDGAVDSFMDAVTVLAGDAA